MKRSLESEDSFAYWVTERIRFSDQDAQSHVNNGALVAYVETGWTNFCQHLGVYPSQGVESFALQSIAVDFRHLVVWPGELRIGARIVAVNDNTFTVGVGVFQDHRCVATATSTLGWTRDGRLERIPEDVRKQLS